MGATNRTKYIDIARGIAILCIILGHQGYYEISKIVFTFHVPIFFFITGYFFNKRQELGDFIKKRVRTLLVPYAVTCIVIILLAVVLEILRGGENVVSVALEWGYASLYGAGDSYTEPFYIKQIGALWFLLATFWGNVFFRIALNMKKHIRIVFVLALFTFGYWTSAHLFWFPLSIQAGCCATMFIYIGYLAKKSKEVYCKLPKEAKVFGTVIATAVWVDFMINFQSFWLVHCDIGRGIIDIVGCICASYMVLMISKGIERVSKAFTNVLSFLGKYSLIVLCIHIIELNLFPWWSVTELLVGFGIPETITTNFVIPIKFVAIISATFVCSKIKVITNLFGMKSVK